MYSTQRLPGFMGMLLEQCTMALNFWRSRPSVTSEDYFCQRLLYAKTSSVRPIDSVLISLYRSVIVSFWLYGQVVRAELRFRGSPSELIYEVECSCECSLPVNSAPLRSHIWYIIWISVIPTVLRVHSLALTACWQVPLWRKLRSEVVSSVHVQP